MYDISVEQILKTKAPKRAVVLKVVMILACILAFSTVASLYAIGIVLTAVFIVFTVLLFKFYDAEYEYSLVENELTVDRIMAKSMRRNCGTYNIEKASLIARMGSQDALRMEHKKLRTYSYTTNMNPEKEVVVYTMDRKNEMVKLLLEPDERMLDAISKVANRNAYKI